MQHILKSVSHFVVPAVAPRDPVTKAVDVMRSRRSDCALVIDQGKLVGIFTERDFAFRIAAMKRDPRVTPIKDVMTADPETLRPRDSIAYAINRMTTRGIRNIPIVDDRGRPMSVLDIRHVMEHISEVFDDLEDPAPESADDEWTDIGGGG